MTKKHKLLKTPVHPKNYLTPLGEKIFLDRYAWKDGSKKSLAVGDTVIVCVDEKTRQREIATVESLDRHEMKAVVRLRDETTKEVAIEHIDKPLETTPDQTMARIARGIAAVETEAKQAEWQKKFEWLLEDWKFVPGGRIWAGAGTDQELTFYNCMPPSQEVLTESGYRPIAEVNVGDMVVTHRNRLRRVLHKFERETEEPIYHIRADGLSDDVLRLTGEHKIHAIRAIDFIEGRTEPQWIPSAHLMVGDFVSAIAVAETVSATVAVTVGGIAEIPTRFQQDGLTWSVITDITTEAYAGWVYDIEVDEDHSFISAGVVVSNCYVVPSPHDSRGGIVKTLQQMMEIMSRGGGVGINVSSLRPRYGYVKGVNGRSSGAVSWGGLYSFVTGLIEQGGCLTPDTLVFTEKGLLRLDEIVTHTEKGWRDHNLTMMTDEGPRQSRSVYNNGVADVLKVETDMGMNITGTPNHKVKVMTDEGPAWRRLDRLQTGDAIMVKLGQHQGQYQSLQHPALKHHNQDAVELPTVLDEKLAYFLGYFMGDGFMTARDGDWRLGVSVAHDSYLMDEMPRLLADLFPGVNVRLQQKENDASVTYVVSNRALKEFLRLNGLEKALSNAVSVPALIRQSPASVVGAFLQGLFEADGGLSHGYPTLMSVSKRLIDEVSTLLIGLGCPVKLDMLPDGGERYGTLPRWRARVHSFRGLAAYCANVGADPRSRFAACLQYHPDLSKEHTYVLPNSRYWVDPVLDAITLPQTDHRAIGERFAATDQPLRRKLLRYVRGDRKLTLSAYATLSEQHEEFASNAPAVNDTWFVFVDRVSAAGQSLTLDLEVDENHTYIANGLVTHNSRRGALMLICNDWHPDVVEFINSKREAGKITNANISVGISDAFMDAVKQDADWDLVFPDTLHPTYDTEWNGDLEAWQAKGYPVIRHKTVKAKEMWNQIIESAWASAEPGLWFRDRANKMSNSWYHSPLICTNPCVTGDTLVSTEEGYIKARDLTVGMKIRTPGGLKPIEKLYNNGVQRIYRVEFSDGGYLEGTADHKVKVVRNKKYEWVAFTDLREGDRVLVSSNETFGEQRELPQEALEYIAKRELKLANHFDRTLGFLAGVVIGDGWIGKDKNYNSYGCQISFGSEEQAWLNYVQTKLDSLAIHTGVTESGKEVPLSDGTVVIHRSVRLAATLLGGLLVRIGMTEGIKASKKSIPTSLLNSEKEVLAGVLDGLFSTDGSVLPKQDNPMLRFHTSSYELAQQVRLILLQFGIHGRIYRAEREKQLQYDGRSMYGTGEKYDVVIMNEGIARFYAGVGLSHPEKAARLKDIAENWHYNGGTWTASVVSVQDMEKEEEVFDLYEPNTLTWVTNGYVSYDCGEQPLPSFGICNLGAVNLAKFVKDGAVDWESLGQTVRYATRFLDNVIDATPYFFPENAEQQGKERRVGLGVMGLAEMMIRLGLRYGSDEGNAFLDDLFKFFASQAYIASAENAAEKGAFPAFDAEKYLQSGFMQGMPEEVRETIREKGARNVTLLTVAPTGTTGTMVSTSTGVEPYYFWSYFRKSRLGVHEEVVDVVKAWRDENPHANGELPDYFVTAMDLSPEDHVKVQAVVQKWIDSSISKTCNVPNHYTVEQTAELYQMMYDLGCKGGTIYRDGSRDEQVLNIKKEEPKAATPGDHNVPVVDVKATELPSFPHISPNYTNVGDHKRKRARRLKGATYFVHTPIGKAFVTVNRNGDEEPFEVFANVGKVGSEGAAMSEALGRLVSLVLRLPSHITPSERLEMVVEQLGGIGGARSIGFGANRVASLPDALAQVLREDLEAHRQDEAAILLGEADPEPQQLELLAVTAQADLCPECGHASFIRIEGCKKCVSCGHAEC